MNNQYYGEENLISGVGGLNIGNNNNPQGKDMAYNYYFGNNVSEIGGRSPYEGGYEESYAMGMNPNMNMNPNLNHTMNHYESSSPEYVNLNVNNYNYNYINTSMGYNAIPEFHPKRSYHGGAKKQYPKKVDHHQNIPFNKQPQVMARYFVIKSVDEDNIHKVSIIS
jgi:hypothetical protein